MSHNQSQEIEEPQHYIKLEIKKIEAVNGLDQLVAQKQVKADRAAFVKQKFEDLRATLASKLASERRLIGETEDLADKIKNGKEDLKRLVKEAAADEEALELVKEDAEQADGEATLAREREQNLLLESGELVRIRDEYNKKIEEIEHDHFNAVAPIIARMGIEIKNAGEEMVENAAKVQTCTKEIEERKTWQSQCAEDILKLVNGKRDTDATLAGLDGVPEKYRKQCDILVNAVQSLRIQEGKWVGKVKEVEAAIQSFHVTKREKTEEHARGAIDIDKMKLLAEQQERDAGDMQKDLEAASLEVEEYLGDRVQLDMILMAKASDLKHENDILVNRLKERDRVIIRLKEREDIVARVQSQMPIFIQEKEKVQRLLVHAEAERKKALTRVEELRKDIDISMNSFMVAEKLGKEVAAKVKESHLAVQVLEKEVMVCVEVDSKRNQHITELTNMRERLSRVAAVKHSKWRETVEKVGLQENFLENFQKREIELQQQYKEFTVLYNLVRSQRNKYAGLIQASAVDH